MVHRREINGQELVFGNQGALWGRAMTLWDHDTGSIWSQPLGEAIAGPRLGDEMELLPSRLTTWDDWLDEHPDSFALASRTARSGFDLDEMSIVVELGDAAAAFPVPDVRDQGVLNVWLENKPLAIVVLPETDSWVVFSRQLDDRVIELAVTGGPDGRPELSEIDGDGRWRALRGLSLTADDQQLALLPGFTSFAADFDTFFPTGLHWVEGELRSP